MATKKTETNTFIFRLRYHSKEANIANVGYFAATAEDKEKAEKLIVKQLKKTHGDDIIADLFQLLNAHPNLEQ